MQVEDHTPKIHCQHCQHCQRATMCSFICAGVGSRGLSLVDRQQEHITHRRQFSITENATSADAFCEKCLSNKSMHSKFIAGTVFFATHMSQELRNTKCVKNVTAVRFFQGRARRSGDGLMESCMCHCHHHHGPPPFTLTLDPLCPETPPNPDLILSPDGMM